MSLKLASTKDEAGRSWGDHWSWGDHKHFILGPNRFFIYWNLARKFKYLFFQKKKINKVVANWPIVIIITVCVRFCGILHRFLLEFLLCQSSMEAARAVHLLELFALLVIECWKESCSQMAKISSLKPFFCLNFLSVHFWSQSWYFSLYKLFECFYNKIVLIFFGK